MNNKVRKELNKIVKKYKEHPLLDVGADEWYYVSRDEKLSEDFIREFQDKVDWKFISWYQKLSKEFIKEFISRLDIKYLAEQKVIEYKVIKGTDNSIKINNKILKRYKIIDLD